MLVHHRSAQVSGILTNHASDNYIMRTYSTSLPNKENVLSEIEFDSKPKCHFYENVSQKFYIYMLCLVEDVVIKYEIANVVVVEFPESDQEYNYRGTIDFCWKHTDICIWFDLPIVATDANEFGLFEGRSDTHGRGYGIPELYNSTMGSIWFDYTTSTLQLQVPVSNYYSGHLLDYDLKSVTEENPDFTLQINQNQRTKETFTRLPNKVSASESSDITVFNV